MGPMKHCNNRLRASLFLRFTDTNVYGTGSVKIWKIRYGLQSIREYTDIFYSVLLSELLHLLARKLSMI